MLRAWWKAHGWGEVSVPESCIPPITLVAEQDGIGLGCVMVYVYEGVSLARIGFCVSNPAAPAKARYQAFRAMAKAVSDELEHRGIVHAQAYFEERGLREAFKAAGFFVSRPAVVEMTWAGKRAGMNPALTTEG